LQAKDLKGVTIHNVAEALFDRMSSARASIPAVEKDVWTDEFKKAAEARKQKMLLTWEAKWPELCDGKRLISDLHKAASLKISESSFKARIVREMRDKSAETWRLVKDILSDFVTSSG
jgi:hypothetical protein